MINSTTVRKIESMELHNSKNGFVRYTCKKCDIKNMTEPQLKLHLEKNDHIEEILFWVFRK